MMNARYMKLSRLRDIVYARRDMEISAAHCSMIMAWLNYFEGRLYIGQDL